MFDKIRVYGSIEEIYVDNEKLIFVFLRDHMKEAELIDELAQILWIKVWNNFDKFALKGKKEVQDYLRAMAANLCADYYKRVRKEQEMLEEYAYLQGLEDNSLCEEEPFPADFSDCLDEAMEILDEEEKYLLLLRYEKQLRYKEIAELLHISENLAAARLKRIRDKLRKKILYLYEKGDEGIG